MHCIYCKRDSSRSKSIEHIIPESLGNIQHTLPPGVVCDECNNYLAREVEKPFLDSLFIVEARLRNRIYNKRGRLPELTGLHLQSGVAVSIERQTSSIWVWARRERDNDRFIKSLLAHKRGTLITPMGLEPEPYVTSRFLGKVALGVLAQRLLDVPDGLDEIVRKRELDELRSFVRLGRRDRDAWPFHNRRIYPEDAIFHSEANDPYQLLHEYTLLYTDRKECYFILALLGTEYAINMGGPYFDGYTQWLARNNQRSPLY